MPITPVKSGGGGSTNSTFYNIKNYNGLVDGSSSDSSAIATLAATLQAAKGGTIYIPEGVCRAHLPLYSKVNYEGSGVDTTTVMLEDGANTDMVYGTVNGYSSGTVMTSVNAANASGLAGGVYNWSIRNMLLDGNKANQSSASAGLHAYAYGFYLEDLVIRNCYSQGLLMDWNAGSGTPGNDAMESFVSNVKVHDNGGMGVDWGGPHDSTWSNVFVFSNGSHGIHIGPNSTGMLMNNVHSYQPPLSSNALGWLIEGNSGQYTGFVSEGSDTVNLVLLAGDCTFVGVRIYGVGAGARIGQQGIQLGQAAGGTPYAGSALQSAGLTTAFQATGNFIDGALTLNNGGSVNFINEANNRINVTAYQTAGSHIVGTPNIATSYAIIPTDALAVDGTIQKGGGFYLPLNSPNALTVNNRTSLIFNVNSNSKIVQFSNGTVIRVYSDSFTTRIVDVGSNGTISVQQSATAVAITNGSQITTIIGISRVNPAGNVTGCTLQNGSLTGQRLIIRNESAFTVLFATSASSKIADADGTTNPIIANRSRTYEWSGSLWYQTN